MIWHDSLDDAVIAEKARILQMHLTAEEHRRERVRAAQEAAKASPAAKARPKRWPNPRGRCNI